ncbi:hypothetical protein O988_06836 [Pseudogymnoascus sp. VKM F-3808]|nr:hypothetical protein O988_06836 [Pseudogymnoascus sp. VKM F-3808]
MTGRAKKVGLKALASIDEDETSGAYNDENNATYSPVLYTDYVMESPQYNQREQALANCKFRYGVETEVLTLHCGDRHQALAIRFDSVTESATILLHTKCHASSTNDAIQYLLQETEIEVAKLFSTNGISIPFLGDLVEAMTIRRGVSYARSSTQLEELEFIATPVSSLPETSVTWNQRFQLQLTPTDSQPLPPQRHPPSSNPPPPTSTNTT